eukprot:gene3439-6826_t
MEKKRMPLKERNILVSQKQKRDLYLESQQKKRAHIVDSHRVLFDSFSSPDLINLESNQESILDSPTQNDEQNSFRKRKEKRFQLRDFYRQQLCTPEWMTEVPDDLSHEWYVLARPEGSRCLVAASRGGTVSRHMDGRIIQSFVSQLPAGGLVGQKSESTTLLDCIYCDINRCYYVIDVMCWKDYLLYDCTAEFRFYWIQSKFQEICNGDSMSCSDNIRFQLVPYFESNHDGLSLAANIAHLNVDKSYIPDGLLFYHKKAHYALGLSPLVLFWKDERTSRYAAVGGEGVAMDGQATTVHIALQLTFLKQNPMTESVTLTETDSMTYGETDDTLSDLQATDACGDIDGNGDGVVDVSENGDGRAQLMTMDGVSLFQMSSVDKTKMNLAEGDIVRCSCNCNCSYSSSTNSFISHDGNNNMFESDLLSSLEVVPLKKCSDRKALPDPWSKISFSLRLTLCPITFDMLIR